jgi:hypothetical protein
LATYKLKINLYGEAWKFKQVLLTEEQKIRFESIAKKMKQPLEGVLTDPYFYHILKSKTIKSIENLPGNSIEGLLNTPKNQIEIWYKNKKVQKLKINDLREELLLFPLYNAAFTDITTYSGSGLYIEQKGIGLVGSYEIQVDNFNIDDLEFQLLKRNGITLLHHLKYLNQPLINKKSDTLITFQNGWKGDSEGF